VNQPCASNIWIRTAPYSGLSVLDFVKGMTVQELSPEGCKRWTGWLSNWPGSRASTRTRVR